MKCPNCHYTFRSGSCCPNCGIDVIIYRKAKAASDKLYNKALSQAKAGDLSGACEALKQSILFNKKNEKARNLLGLVYYEMGRIADALMHWIISSSLVKENNPAKKYIDTLQNNAREMEKYNDSVRMYNQALTYLTQKNEDLAIIQLKKAVDFSPKFLEAWNLLALCYSNRQEHNKAVSCIEKVLALDFNNPKAMQYARELNPTKMKKDAKNTKNGGGKQPRMVSTFRYPERRTSVIGKTEIVSFVVGIICTTAVLMTLIVPAWVDAKTNKITELEKKVAQLQKEGGSASNVSEEYAVIKAENERLKQENQAYQEKETLQIKLDKISQASALSEQNDVQSAALLLAEVDATGLPEESDILYKSLRENIYPEAAKSFYNVARTQFMNKNYDEALGNFENSLKFANGEDFVDDSVYYLGKIAEEKGDIEKAKSYFQRIINEFPDSNQFKNAENSLNNLNAE